MVVLKRITPDDAESFRAVRLGALQDAPFAFGSTYAKESRWPDEEWKRRAAQWTGERSIAYLAWDAHEPCGIAAGFLGRDDEERAELISMWVAPTHRRQGVGRLLVEGVSDWARSRRARSVRLMVTATNEAAICFYESLGFVKTGRTEPYPNDPALLEFEMIHSLGTPAD